MPTAVWFMQILPPKHTPWGGPNAPVTSGIGEGVGWRNSIWRLPASGPKSAKKCPKMTKMAIIYPKMDPNPTFFQKNPFPHTLGCLSFPFPGLIPDLGKKVAQKKIHPKQGMLKVHNLVRMTKLLCLVRMTISCIWFAWENWFTKEFLYLVCMIEKFLYLVRMRKFL